MPDTTLTTKDLVLVVQSIATDIASGMQACLAVRQLSHTLHLQQPDDVRYDRAQRRARRTARSMNMALVPVLEMARAMGHKDDFLDGLLQGILDTFPDYRNRDDK